MNKAEHTHKNLIALYIKIDVNVKSKNETYSKSYFLKVRSSMQLKDH